MTEPRDASHYVRTIREQKFPKKQVAAAKAAKLSQPYLSQVETGKRKLTAKTALKMERGWGLKEYDLLKWVGTDPGNDLRSANNDIPGYLCRLMSPPPTRNLLSHRTSPLPMVA